MTPRAVALYATLLTLYPRPMREEYGDAMVQLFADRYRDERPQSDVFRFARFWGGILGDLVRTALAERTESVVSNFKQQWWKWAIGLVAAFYAVFVVESLVALAFESDDHVARFVIPTVGAAGVVAIVAGLRTMKDRPRFAAWLLVVGLIPAIASGFVFFWFPPMYAVSALAIYLAIRSLMEAGRLTRAGMATA